MALKPWVKLDRKTIFKNDHWCYNLDHFEIGKNGSKGEYHYVHTLGSTLIIPVLANNSLLLVNQYRYLNQRESIEFPCGSVEVGLTDEQNAIKELREETGKSCRSLELVGEFSPFTGACDEMCKVYLAKDLYDSPLPHDNTEEFELLELTIDKFEKMISENIIYDGMTLSAWLKAKNKIVG